MVTPHVAKVAHVTEGQQDLSAPKKMLQRSGGIIKNDCRHRGRLFLSQGGESHMFRPIERKRERARATM